MQSPNNSNSNEALQSVFRALSDPTRRAILCHLSHQEMTIAEVLSHFDMTRAAVKKHLLILEEGDLISVHRRGRETLNQFKPEALKRVFEWLEYFDQYWDTKLTALERAIEQHEAASPTNPGEQ